MHSSLLFKCLTIVALSNNFEALILKHCHFEFILVGLASSIFGVGFQSRILKNGLGTFHSESVV